MTSKFYPKPALFESKSQVMGNWIVFHRELSDAAKILVFALNGIFTCTHTWVPVQCDLQKRLGWGKEKMRNTIKECQNAGFLRVTQGRHKSGEFACHDFEFCIDASFKENSIHFPQENTPHNESEPETGLRCPDNRNPDNQTLPCSKNKTVSLEEQQTTGASPPEPPSLPAAVVVPLEKEKRTMLLPYDLSEKVISELIAYDVDRIKDAIESLRLAQSRGEVPNPSGFIVSAIRDGYKPSKTKEDLAKEFEEQLQKAISHHIRIKNEALRMQKQCSTDFNENYSFKVTDVIELKTKKGIALIYFSENNCLKKLAEYIEKKGKI